MWIEPDLAANDVVFIFGPVSHELRKLGSHLLERPQILQTIEPDRCFQSVFEHLLVCRSPVYRRCEEQKKCFVLFFLMNCHLKLRPVIASGHELIFVGVKLGHRTIKGQIGI